MISIETIAEQDREAMMNVIRDALYGRTKDELTSLAHRIGRTYDCLVRIRSGRTKWPTGATLFSLIYVCDLRMVLLPTVRKVYDHEYEHKAMRPTINHRPH